MCTDLLLNPITHEEFWNSSSSNRSQLFYFMLFFQMFSSITITLWSFVSHPSQMKVNEWIMLIFHSLSQRNWLQAYKQKLYGPKHVWFVIGWYADNWYMVRDTNCTIEQMQEVLKGHFTTEGLMLNQNQNTPSISGMVRKRRLRRVQVVLIGWKFEL
jgi:hypothetical protein